MLWFLIKFVDLSSLLRNIDVTKVLKFMVDNGGKVVGKVHQHA